MPESLINEFLQAQFPRLKDGTYEILSPADRRYNCIAWAAEDSNRWWWPRVGVGGYYWPTPVTTPSTLETFEAAFASLGYVRCADGNLQAGFEKIALYGLNGVPTHAARQRSDGAWLSKLGMSVDIMHTAADDVCGSDYGEVAFFMERPLPQRG